MLPLQCRSRPIAATLCALPPLLCAAYVRDTTFVFSLCGLSGYAIVFFVPAALQLAAARASLRQFGEAGRVTPHTTCLSSATAVYSVAAAGMVAFLYDMWIVLVRPLAFPSY